MAKPKKQTATTETAKVEEPAKRRGSPPKDPSQPPRPYRGPAAIVLERMDKYRERAQKDAARIDAYGESNEAAVAAQKAFSIVLEALANAKEALSQVPADLRAKRRSGSGVRRPIEVGMSVHIQPRFRDLYDGILTADEMQDGSLKVTALRSGHGGVVVARDGGEGAALPLPKSHVAAHS